MSINGIGQRPFMTGYPMADTRRAGKNEIGEAFGSHMDQMQRSQMSGGAFVLHYFDGEDGDHAVSASCGTDYSVTVYEPKDFDPANPVYKVKTWDKDGNTVERMVDVSKVDPKDSDFIDMYAYACHVSKNGQCSDALSSFMGSGTAIYGMRGRTYEDLTNKVNWMAAVKEMMQMQYDTGNLQGYLGYKKFFDFLMNEEERTSSIGTGSVSNNLRISAKEELEVIQKQQDNIQKEVVQRQQDSAREKTASYYWEREFENIGANAPASVKQAWMEAAAVAGADGMGMTGNGMLSHISQLMVKQVEKSLRGENSHDLLGGSVQSAASVAEEALYALEHPLAPRRDQTPEVVKARDRERIFYQEFLSRLQKLETA